MSPGSCASVVEAKTGAALLRSFHHAASEPCGSVSIRATGPQLASSACTARWPDSVVLPEPPFCEQSATTCIDGSRGGAACRLRPALGAARRRFNNLDEW